MLYNLLLTLLIIDSLVLIAAVLLQAGKGGGLAASFGGASSSADAFIGIRQAGNLLTRTSWWAGGIFLLLAFVLQISSTRARAPRSVLDQPFAAPTAPPPTTGAPQTTTPNQALPLSPAAPATGGAPATTPATPSPTPQR